MEFIGPSSGVISYIRTSHPLVVEGIWGTCISYHSAQKLPCIRRRSTLCDGKRLHVNIGVRRVTGRKLKVQKMGCELFSLRLDPRAPSGLIRVGHVSPISCTMIRVHGAPDAVEKRLSPRWMAFLRSRQYRGKTAHLPKQETV